MIEDGSWLHHSIAPLSYLCNILLVQYAKQSSNPDQCASKDTEIRQQQDDTHHQRQQSIPERHSNCSDSDGYDGQAEGILLRRGITKLPNVSVSSITCFVTVLLNYCCYPEVT